MKSGKFKVVVESGSLFDNDSIFIADLESNDKLDCSSKEDMMKLVNVLNDYHNIIKKEWGFKK